MAAFPVLSVREYWYKCINVLASDKRIVDYLQDIASTTWSVLAVIDEATAILTA